MLPPFASPSVPSSAPTISSWPRHSSQDGSWSSWERTFGERTFPSALPTASSSPLKSVCGLPRSCGDADDRRLMQLLAGGQADQRNLDPRGQQWLYRCECAVPGGLSLCLLCPWLPFSILVRRECNRSGLRAICKKTQDQLGKRWWEELLNKRIKPHACDRRFSTVRH